METILATRSQLMWVVSLVTGVYDDRYSVAFAVCESPRAAKRLASEMNHKFAEGKVDHDALIETYDSERGEPDADGYCVNPTYDRFVKACADWSERLKFRIDESSGIKATVQEEPVMIYKR